jgi:hypothetical protein
VQCGADAIAGANADGANTNGVDSEADGGVGLTQDGAVDSPWIEVDILPPNSTGISTNTNTTTTTGSPASSGQSSSVIIDLSSIPADSHVIAIRYAWENVQKACCARTEYYG